MTKSEYVSAKKACQQALWMKQALINYDIRLDDVLIMCDNKGAIDLSKNPVQHSRTKHIEIHHHFLRNNVQKGNIFIEKVSSEDNIADILTKPLKCESSVAYQGAFLTIISDGHKGLMEVVHTMLPYAKHMQCARHIYANFKKKWNGLHYKFLLGGAVGNRNLNSWSKSFFKMDKGCRAYENGIYESYHNSIRIARGPSIVGGSAVDVDESGPIGVDKSATITENPIEEFENEIPTQTSRTSMKEVVEASIAAGTLKLAGSSANKDWDVDTMKDVVFEVYLVKHW
ncbi:hypothetical protein Tco_1187361 [Tanacetum coccineum]